MLFDDLAAEHRDAARPLADRLRPSTLDGFVGQTHLLGSDSKPGPLRRAIAGGRFTSLLFYGPPGTGKTTLARIAAAKADAEFAVLNAAAVGVKEVRDTLAAARDRLETGGRRTVLFVDELHHFNKTQQDVLLPDIERGVVLFIGATTANPYFSLVSALISRSLVFEFRGIEPDDIAAALRRAIAVDTKLSALASRIADDAIDALTLAADGDVRRALTLLEIIAAAATDAGEAIDAAFVRSCQPQKPATYDAGDTHYDVASAYIKSMRGRDADAALYWLARMIEGGEDPRFIARRLVIAAAEDVGNADPQALVIAEAAAAATDRIGLPECRIPLAQATIYVTLAEKSDAAYRAIGEAIRNVREQPLVNVPDALRDPNRPQTDGVAAAASYRNPHRHPDTVQDYLPGDRVFYRPGPHGREAVHRELLNRDDSRSDDTTAD